MDRYIARLQCEGHRCEKSEEQKLDNVAHVRQVGVDLRLDEWSVRYGALAVARLWGLQKGLRCRASTVVNAEIMQV